LGEEIDAAEVARLEGDPQALASGSGLGVAPGDTRIDLRADLQLRDAQRLDAGARGLATGHDEAAHPAGHEAGGDGGDAALDEFTGVRAAQLLLRGGYRFGL